VDHAFTENHRAFVRLHYDWWEEDKNRHFNNDVNGIVLNRINRDLAIDDVLVIQPTLVCNFDTASPSDAAARANYALNALASHIKPHARPPFAEAMAFISTVRLTPPALKFIADGRLDAKRRPRPIGISQKPLMARRCGRSKGVVIRQAGPALGFGNAIFNGDLHDIPLPKDQRDVDRWFNTAAGFNRDSLSSCRLTCGPSRSDFPEFVPTVARPGISRQSKISGSRKQPACSSAPRSTTQ
jgi:hypothetical protein